MCTSTCWVDYVLWELVLLTKNIQQVDTLIILLQTTPPHTKSRHEYVYVGLFEVATSFWQLKNVAILNVTIVLDKLLKG